MHARAFTLATMIAIASCSEDAAGPADGGGGGGEVNVVTTHPDAEPIAPATECTVTTAEARETSGAHVEPCAEVSYETVPPCTGTHYSSWADYGVYDAPVPWGFLVHCMEHGGVVLSYGCDAAECPDVVAAMEAIASEQTDSLCAGANPNRIVVAPDPTLPAPVAAAAWGHVYRATCLDEPGLRAFVDAHYADAPEDTCAGGVDLSATGWCP